MLEYLLAFSILKAPLGTKIYLNIIPILVGLGFFLKNRRINLLFLPLIILLSFGAIKSLSLMDINSLLRLGQVGCLIAFASMTKNWVNTDSLYRMSRLMFYLGAFALGWEMILMIPLPPKIVFGQELFRYNGPIGESNYSALLFAFAAIIFILKKDWLHFVGTLVCIYFCVSRTAIVMILFFSILLILHYFLKDKLKWPLRIFSVLLCLTPFLVWMAYQFVPLELLQKLEKISSGRIFLYIPYVDMGMDNLFGVGYFNGWGRYEEYLQRFMNVDTGRNRQINEQHNIFIQVFSEFGILLYPLWCWQIIKVYWQKHLNLIPLILFSTLLVGFSFLNGLNEFIFYLAFAWIISTNDIRNTNLTGLFNVKSC